MEKEVWQSVTINGDDEEATSWPQALQITSSYMLPVILNFTVELDVFGIIARAGGTRISASEIASEIPAESTGINFDLPRVIRDAPSYSGIEHGGGDMFVTVLKGDAIMIRTAIITKKGKVIAITILMPEAPDSSSVSKYITQMDNLMLMTLESHERTLKQLETLCKVSGFSEFRVADKLTRSIWAVIEFCR
ncbi:caffeic acid 3-O-methyltransferase-like [Punica granatum]|uniref:Caffeic acid 3-O-methyltransferase-like n=1 Tax=Punica granatum TaxID=22663 RepID=A0A6P8E845_PUNGR|nr:caffeic acid 3-O-methyltransferase-like [Punica granatum]